MDNKGMAKPIQSEKNPAMSESQITSRINGMDNAERIVFLVAMTDIQKIMHELDEREQKVIRSMAEILETIIRMDSEKQKIALAMLSSRIVESETPTSLMRRFTST